MPSGASSADAATSCACPPTEPATRRMSRPEPSRRRRLANPTGPRPCAAARTAQASRSAARSPASSRSSVTDPVAAVASGPAAPIPSISARLGRGAACGRRAEPGGLVEMRLGDDRVARPGRRSSSPPGAGARSPGRWPPRAPPGARRGARPTGSSAQAARRARPVRRPFSASRRPAPRVATPPGQRRSLLATTADGSGSGPTHERGGRHARHLDPQVDPVAQRSRHASAGSARRRRSGTRTADPTSRRSRTGTGSSRRSAGTGPGTSSHGRPGRSRPAPPPAAGAALRGRRGRTPEARRGTARRGPPA